MPTEDSVRFSLRYEGPETEHHLINAGELARSLMGLSTAVDVIAQCSLDEGSKAELLVSAKLREGSAVADLVLNLTQYSPTLIAGLAFMPSSARDFVELITDIVKLARLFQGNEVPQDAVSEQPDGRVMVQYNNCNFYSTSGALSMYGNMQVRDSLRDTFSPVSNGKIREIDVLDENGEKLESVDAETAGFLPIPTVESTPASSSYKNVVVTVRRASLDDSKGWGFSWKGTQFSATIRDQSFLQAVEERKYQFAHGDQLRVDLEVSSGSNKSGMKWFIKKVHEFIPAQVQERMF